MTMIAVPDRMTFTAPAPDAVATATVQTVGQRGLATYYYWIVSHFPIGIVVSEPFGIWNAPNTLDASNYVNIVWTGTAGATDYDLLRTLTPVYPSLPGNYALALGLTVTQFRDQGQALSAYNITGLPHGAPVSCHVQLNNRDFEQPVLQLPCRLGVTQLLFPDGSSQTTAGGAAIKIKGSVADHAALLALPGPHDAGDAWIVLSPAPPHMWIWNGSAWIDSGPAASVSAAGSNGQIQFNNGGLFGASSSLAWQVMWGNTQPVLRSDGLNVLDANPNEGVQVWYDSALGTPPGQGGIYAFNFATQTYKRFYLDGDPLLLNSDIGSTGHIGIHVTNPQTGLHVNDTVFITGSTSSPTTGAGVEVWYDGAVGTPAGQGGIDAFDFDTQIYKRFYLDGNPLILNSDLNSHGNIGVHNETPECALDVNGGIRTTGSHDWPSTGKGVIMFYNPPSASVLPETGFIQCLDFPAQVTPTVGFMPLHIDGDPLCLNTDGDLVGINTLTPAYELDVTGDINCTGTFRVNGTPIATTAAVGATSPASPQMGQFWYDNVNFRLMIFLGSWIQVA